MRKKRFNLLDKYFTVILTLPFLWLFFGGMSIAGMRSMGEVSIPVSIETGSFFFGQEKPEPHGGFFMLKEDCWVEDAEPMHITI